MKVRELLRLYVRLAVKCRDPRTVRRMLSADAPKPTTKVDPLVLLSDKLLNDGTYGSALRSRLKNIAYSCSPKISSRIAGEVADSILLAIIGDK